MATISFLSSSGSDTDATEYTFATATLGTAATDRYIIVSVASDSSDGTEKTATVTVQGISATLVKHQGGAGRNSGAMYIVAVPTGTTGDIVVTWSGTLRNMGLGWYRAVGLSSATAYDVDAASSTGVGTTIATSIDIPSNAIVVGNGVTGGAGASWTNLTEDYERTSEFGTAIATGAGGTNSVSAQGGYTITLNTEDSARRIIIAASWGTHDLGFNTNHLRPRIFGPGFAR